MLSLREVQRKLKTVFTHPRGVAAGLSAAGFGGKRPVTRIVADQPPVPLTTRLAVYSDGYFLRLLETLGQDFAAVKRAVGEESFQRLAADYLIDHPSRSPLVNDIGAPFAAFLKRHPSSKESPFLSDLAALEWAALQALFTDRLPPADPAVFAGMGLGARLRLDPTVTLLETTWAVDLLWGDRERADGKGRRRLSKPSTRRLLVYRDDAWVKIAPLDAAEFETLERLKAGQPLGKALAALKGTAAAQVQGWFARWTRNGVVKGVVNR